MIHAVTNASALFRRNITRRFSGTFPPVYECSCGFTSITATAFYRHLAQYKDASGTHQLIQAKPSDLPLSLQPSKPPAAAVPSAPTPATTASLGLHQLSPGTLNKPRSQRAAGVVDVDLQDKAAPRSSSFSVPAVPAAPAVPAVCTTSGAGTGNLLDVLQVMHQNMAAHQQKPHPLPLSQGAADTDTVEINCRQPALDRQDLGSAPSGAAMQDMLMSAGSAMSSILLYGLNPLRLFGLTEAPATGAVAPRSVPGAPAPAAGPVLAAAPGGGRAAADAEAEARRVVASFDAVLLWRDPWRSFRVFAMLLYVGICCQQVSSGALPILPSTALLAAALLYLTQNSIRASMGGPAAPAQQLPPPPGGGAAPASPTASTHEAQELRLYLAVQSALEASARLFIPPLAAGVVLLHRALSGRRLVTTAIVWTCLWFAMFLGELRLMDQLQFAMLIYVALFTVPALYVRSREGLDVLVEDLVRLLLRLLLHSSRMALGGSALSALVTLACTSGWSPVLRASAAAAAALAVLLWQARPAAQPAAPSAQNLPSLGGAEKPKAQ